MGGQLILSYLLDRLPFLYLCLSTSIMKYGVVSKKTRHRRDSQSRYRDMAEKPTYQEFLNDLVQYIEKLPYAEEHINVWEEGQITVKCQEGTIVLRASVQPTGIV
jgi:hypothetical protein